MRAAYRSDEIDDSNAPLLSPPNSHTLTNDGEPMMAHRQRQPGAYAHTSSNQSPIAHPSSVLYQVESFNHDLNDEHAKKIQTTLTQERQRKLIIFLLIALIALFMLNRRPREKVPDAREPYPVHLVLDSPAPNASTDTIPVIASAGIRYYSLPPSITHGEPILQQEFAVYLPSKLDRSNAAQFYGKLSTKHELYRSFPLVVSLHGRGENATTEVDIWSEYAERYGWIVVCPNILATSDSSYSQLQLSVQYIELIMNSVLGPFDLDDSISSLSLTRLIDRRHILLTGHEGGGYALLNFLLHRPNYWTAASGRSINFWQQHGNEVIKPMIQREAIEARTRGTWKPTGITPSTPVDHIGELYSSEIYSSRPFLLQFGEFDDSSILEEIDDLHAFLRTIGFRRITYERMLGEHHHTRADVTAKWFVKQIKK